MSDAYEEGWKVGYDDLLPECPYEDDTREAKDWWEGYEQGSRDC